MCTTKQTVTKFFLTFIPPFCSEGIVGRIWKETKRSLHHNSDNLLSYIAKYSHNNQFLLQPKSKSYSKESTLLFLCIIWVPTWARKTTWCPAAEQYTALNSCQFWTLPYLDNKCRTLQLKHKYPRILIPLDTFKQLSVYNFAILR